MILLGECTTQVSGGRIIEIVRIPGLLEIVCGGEKNWVWARGFPTAACGNPRTAIRKLFGS